MKKYKVSIDYTDQEIGICTRDMIVKAIDEIEAELNAELEFRKQVDSGASFLRAYCIGEI